MIKCCREVQQPDNRDKVLGKTFTVLIVDNHWCYIKALTELAEFIVDSLQLLSFR